MKRAPAPEFRVAILGPLSGDRSPARLPARAIEIDAESFDGVLDRLAPSVTLAAAGADGGDFPHGIHSIADFHPDALLETVPALSALTALRRTVADTRTFSEVAAEIDAASGEERVPAKPEGHEETLERLLGTRPPGSRAEVSARDAVDRLAREAVAPHIVASPDPRQSEWMKAIDAALTERLRALLRQPTFRALEGLWRGIHRLVLRVEVGGPVHVHLLSARAADLAGDRTVLLRALETTRSSEGIDRFDLLVVPEALDATEEGLAAVAGLAALAEALDATALASADPGLVGAPGISGLGDPSSWSRLPAPAAERWESIRRLPEAKRVVLALPGVLARAPYGAKSDPIAAFAFEEAADRPGSDGFCFGPAALACAEAVVEAAGREDPEPLALAAAPLGDLPFGIFEAPDGRHIQPCAEALLPDRAVERLLDAGLTPIAAHAQRPDVRIVRIQPIGK